MKAGSSVRDIFALAETSGFGRCIVAVLGLGLSGLILDNLAVNPVKSSQTCAAPPGMFSGWQVPIVSFSSCTSSRMRFNDFVLQFRARLLSASLVSSTLDAVEA